MKPFINCLSLYLLASILCFSLIFCGVLLKLDLSFNSTISFLISYTFVIFLSFYYKFSSSSIDSFNTIKLFKYLLVTILCWIIINYSFFVIYKGYDFSVLKNIKSYSVWLLISNIFFAPILQEFIFRKISIDYLVELNKSKISIIVFTAICFGISHIVDIYQIIYTSLLGLVLGYVYLKERNVAYPIIIHLVNNVLAYVFEFQNVN